MPDDRLVAVISAAVQAYMDAEAAALPDASGRSGRAWKMVARNLALDSAAMRALSWRGR